MDYRETPALMAEQKKNNKKDRYIEITECLKSAYKALDLPSQAKEFTDVISAVLENMDPQIYEHYRALYDIKKELTQMSCGEIAIPTPTLSDSTGALPENVDISAGVSDKKYVVNHFLVSRAATFEICGAGRHYTAESYSLFLEGKYIGEIKNVIFTIFDLVPGTSYNFTIKGVETNEEINFSIKTPDEFVTLNVKDFGAAGDGVTDDTHFIQAAIMACPANSRILIPAGIYKITNLFLKSDINIELARGARLCADTDRMNHARFPGRIETADTMDEYHLGTWEGNPLPMFAGIICGMNAENINFYGQGIIDGNASPEDWWKNPKMMNVAYRPRLLFLNNCKNVNFAGVTFTNSPSWTIHPFFSDNLGFYNINEINPSYSPNTDGLDPESCNGVKILGVHFSLGDDCIAIKSGKIYMGSKYKKPSENISIRHCLMEDGHGAVTIGSEMAGGVKNVTVEDCLFLKTDRGLRIKTRRGRGEDAIVDGITFKNITMNHVMTPFVINCFYFCDPDGKTEFVQSRDKYPVNETTPYIGKLDFINIDATDCHVAAAHYDGLPEQKIKEVVMENVSISFAEECKSGVPAMSEGVEECTKKGIFARNVEKLTLNNVNISGQVGEALILDDVDEIIR